MSYLETTKNYWGLTRCITIKNIFFAVVFFQPARRSEAMRNRSKKEYISFLHKFRILAAQVTQVRNWTLVVEGFLA